MGITGALVILPLCKEIPIRSGFAKIHGLPSMIALRFYRYVPGITGNTVSAVLLAFCRGEPVAVKHTITDPAITGRTTPDQPNIIVVIGDICCSKQA